MLKGRAKEEAYVKLVKKIKIRNELGLHARPAALIVKILQPTKSMVNFTYRNETINARSIMSVLMLAAQRNTLITVTVEGDDAEYTLSLLEKAFENKFGEDCCER